MIVSNDFFNSEQPKNKIVQAVNKFAKSESNLILIRNDFENFETIANYISKHSDCNCIFDQNLNSIELLQEYLKTTKSNDIVIFEYQKTTAKQLADFIKTNTRKIVIILDPAAFKKHEPYHATKIL